VLTASWIKEKALDLWDMRYGGKKVANLNVASSLSTVKKEQMSGGGGKNGEYLYACKFFSTSNYNPNRQRDDNDIDEDNDVFTSSRSSRRGGGAARSSAKQDEGSTATNVLACGSGTQSLHLIDYAQQARDQQQLAVVNCDSPLYCLDAIYSTSLIACGGMNNFYTIMASSSSPSSSSTSIY
jgi:hypothetical protein